jgi:hypothetical protein
MYTVINRIPVPASDPGAFEEHFAASMSAPGQVEAFKTVADLSADGRDA